jgi:hypothetical protein
MRFHEAAATIEGRAFSARVNAASDLSTFLRAVLAESAVAELILLLGREDVAFRLLRRTVMLVAERVDYKYENPRDAAIATYVWLLSDRYPLLAQVAAEAALLISRSWWAPRIAERVLQGKYTEEGASSAKAVLGAAPSINLSTPDTGNAPFFVGSATFLESDEGWLSDRALYANEERTAPRFTLLPGEIEITNRSLNSESLWINP